MAFVLKDRVKETTTTSGTGSITLSGAVRAIRDSVLSVKAIPLTTALLVLQSGRSGLGRIPVEC
jgi:hypothetical protein